MSNLKKSIAFGLSLMSGMSVVAPTITVFAATEKEVKVDAELQKCLDAVVFEDAEAIASTIEEFKKSVEEEAKLISKGEKSSAELKISLDNIDLEKDAVAGEEVKYIDETDKANLVLTPYKNEEDKVVGYILKMTRTGLGEKIDEKIAELKARYTDEYIASNYDEETQEKVKEELTKQIENLLNATEENLEQIYQEAVDTLEEFKNKLDVLKDEYKQKVDDFDTSVYRKTEKEKLEESKEKTKEAIDEASSEAEIREFYNSFEEITKTYKTDVELTAEETKANEENAKKLENSKEKSLTAMKSYLPLSTYNSTSEQKILNNLLDTYTKKVKDAKTTDELATILKDYKSAVDKAVEDIKTERKATVEKELKEAKTKAINEIKNYKNLKDYNSEQKKAIKSIIAKYKDKINVLTKVDKIDALVSEAKGKLNLIKVEETKNDNTKKNDETKNDSSNNSSTNVTISLDTQKVEAKKAIRRAVEGKEYRETQAKEIEALLDEYDKKIQESTSKEALDIVVKEATEKLTAVKTNEQLKAEGNTSTTGVGSTSSTTGQNIMYKDSKQDGTANSVQTGDNTSIATIGILGILSSSVLGFFAIKRKRK